MAILNNKIDFVAFVSVKNANANGDPLNGNRPRTDYNGFGEMSDVCIKRKIRNRLQDMGEKIFVQSAERADDGCTSLSQRADDLRKKNKKDTFEKFACSTWFDVRAFGQLFSFKDNERDNKVPESVRGPVSIHQATSITPVDVYSMKITKSVNGKNVKPGTKAPDTMGTKHFVRYGLYKVKGSINVQLAEKTGFTEEDAEKIKEAIRTLFVNDSSSARPDGSMEVVKLYWFKHNCKDGQYSSAEIHRSVTATLKDGVQMPSSVDDYTINCESLEGLAPEVIDGV